MKHSTFRVLSFSLLCALSHSSYADNVLIPGHVASEINMELPQRGTSMDNVRYKFGNPNQEKLPVGNPPITQWEYDGFNVFFEHQHVIHAVNLETLIMPQ